MLNVFINQCSIILLKIHLPLQSVVLAVKFGAFLGFCIIEPYQP